ncbi:ABC-three component system protein [Actinoplanes sp. NPDC049316]|uniref:ABC-three component system protein n=1 Tax=Actinoplanes sp. NPDC049316 TaxID=3154727 RepID=UPI0034328E1B
MALSIEDQCFVRAILRRKLEELFENAFEQFFQSIMCARYPDFINVRTHGNIGDIGADGLSLHDRKLYACYGPQVPDAKEVRRKFRSDLQKGIDKRGGQFNTFVFVHNDLRGVHPEVSIALNEAAVAYSKLRFQQMGPPQIHRELCRLERDVIADVLCCEFPAVDRVWRVGPNDLEPLLAHLVAQRRNASAQPLAREVPPDKLDYNRLGPEDRDEIVQAMRYTPLLEDYYQSRTDVTERDEVAQGFNSYYREVKAEYDDPGDVLWKLQEYVAGNARRSREQERAVMVVLAYFFETCDIFEEPPANWTTSAVQGVSG